MTTDTKKPKNYNKKEETMNETMELICVKSHARDIR